MKRHTILFLALFGAAACGNEFTSFDEDVTESEGEDDGGESGPACVDFGDACTACERTACEASFCECYGNVDCGLYADCTFACADWDWECYQACNTAHPNGISDAVLLNDCAADSCEAECAGYPLIELTPCQQCTYESCETQMNSCLANPACTELVFCINDCFGDTSCQESCYATHPGGVTDMGPVGQCAINSCAAECS